jgi:hypothetical protein
MTRWLIRSGVARAIVVVALVLRGREWREARAIARLFV